MVGLAHAMVSVSRSGRPDFPVADALSARRILAQIPFPVMQRAWTEYKAGIREDRFFATRKLYSAPEMATHTRRLKASDDNHEASIDSGVDALATQLALRRHVK